MIIIQKLKIPEENHTSYHSKGNGKSHSLQMSEKLLADMHQAVYKLYLITQITLNTIFFKLGFSQALLLVPDV